MIPDRQTLSLNLADAYTTLISKLGSGFAASELVLEYAADLTAARNQILVQYAADPKQLGSNEAARDAKIAAMTTVHADLVRDAERNDRNWRHEIELARLRVEGLRAQLRLLELGTPRTGGEPGPDVPF